MRTHYVIVIMASLIIRYAIVENRHGILADAFVLLNLTLKECLSSYKASLATPWLIMEHMT